MQTREFIVGTRQQREWGWLLILDLFLSGTGAALFLIASILGDIVRMAVGVGLVLLGGCFLLADLSRPLHAWRAFLRPQSSWVSRGIIGITGFALLAVVQIVYLAIQLDGLTSLGAPWGIWPAWLQVYGVVLIAGAIFVASYPGFLLGSMRPIALWNSAYLSALFLVSALVSGLGVVYLVPLNLVGHTQSMAFLQNLSIGLIILSLFLFFSLILLVYPETTRESIRLLTQGSMRFYFFIGVLGLGLIVPLIILALFYRGGGMTPLLPIAGVLLLLGMLLWRYVIVRAGILVSPVL